MPAGTRAAANTKVIPVKNMGDAPLVFADSAATITAAAANAPSETEFAVVSNDCRNKTLAPAESCSVNVGFKPTRISTFSSAVLLVLLRRR